MKISEFLNTLPPEYESVIKEGIEFKNSFYDKKSPVAEEWKGHRFMANFLPETAKFAYQEWTPKSGDIFIISYPKTGIHWVAEICAQIIYRDNPEQLELYRSLFVQHEILEVGPKSKFAILDKLPLRRRIFISHLPPNLVNLKKYTECNVKVLTLVRNPKDQAVSWYFFSAHCPEAVKYSSHWDLFLKSYINGEQVTLMPSGQWYPDYLRLWQEHKSSGHLTVAYENLHKNFDNEVQRIALYINENLTASEIKQVNELCSFGTMKKIKNQAINLATFRKGVVGDWKNYFTNEQSKLLDENVKAKLNGITQDFIYEL